MEPASSPNATRIDTVRIKFIDGTEGMLPVQTITVGGKIGAVGYYTVYVGVTVEAETATASASFHLIPEFPQGTVVIALAASLAVLGALVLFKRNKLRRLS